MLTQVSKDAAQLNVFVKCFFEKVTIFFSFAFLQNYGFFDWVNLMTLTLTVNVIKITSKYIGEHEGAATKKREKHQADKTGHKNKTDGCIRQKIGIGKDQFILYRKQQGSLGDGLRGKDRPGRTGRTCLKSSAAKSRGQILLRK